MQSTMMQSPLLLTRFLERARALFPRQEVVTRLGDEIDRSNYGEVVARSLRLASALQGQGMARRDCVATLAWNTRRHLELYCAVPALGAVLHTVNFRLSVSQIEAILRHARDRLIFTDAEFVPRVKELLPRLESVERVVVMGGEGADGETFADYESFLATGDEAAFTFPELDENDPCGLCYTSGTTGDPKGVVYSHRSNVLHALVSASSDACGVSLRSVLLPVVPMFHVNAWGLPYTSVLTGAKLVLPGPHLDPQSLLRLMEDEGVTLGAGIPTVWRALLAELDAGFPKPSRLETLLVGGAAAPRSMIEGFQERHAIHVVHAWGMTETSPLGTVCTLKPGLPSSGKEHYDYRVKQGLPGALLETRIMGDSGEEQPWDGESMGVLEIRGPWVTDGYFRDQDSRDEVMTEDGWFRTGDVATIDEEGYVSIVDRTKDLIRSGGEWISSVKLESRLVAHEAILEAAVIPMRDPRWGERPLGCIVFEEGKTATEEELNEFLLVEFPGWQLPDRYEVLSEIPRTAVGKIDKKKLRSLTSSPGE